MKRLFVIRIGVVIESHKHNVDASWGDTNVIEEDISMALTPYEDAVAIIDIAGVRELKEGESNEDALNTLM